LSYNHGMELAQVLAEKINDIVALAGYAPSVHNTQSWRVKTRGNKIFVRVDPRYRLVDGDPTGRQTIISLGIFSEALKIAAMVNGLHASKLTFDGEEVEIHICKSGDSDNSERSHTIAALKSRVTDRSIYRPIEISKSTRGQIIDAAKEITAKIWLLTDKNDVYKIAEYTSKGIGLALSNPNFRHELSTYLVVPWSKKRRGISTSSLYIPKILAVCEPLFMRLGIGLKQEVNLERRRWLSSSGIVLITTPGDMPDHWFEAGRAYLKVALKIEKLGLSQATSAAMVEASNYHEDVEAMLKTTQRLQGVIRIGQGSRHRVHSPRVSTKELITSS